MIYTELIDIFKEYRNGNEEVLNILYTLNVEYDKDGNYKNSKLVLNDKGLNRCVNLWYRIYSLPYIFEDAAIEKHYEQVYNGSIEDLKQDLLMALIELFRDTSFNPITNSEIYSTLKYRMSNLLGDNIKFSIYAIQDTLIDEDNEKYSLIESVPCNGYIDNCNSPSKHIGVIDEIATILRRHNVKDLLKRNDCDTQYKIIDLIYKYYDYYYDEKTNCLYLPEQARMMDYYYYEYGEMITQDNYTKALNHIFKALMELTVSYKDTDINRGDFVRKKKN